MALQEGDAFHIALGKMYGTGNPQLSEDVVKAYFQQMTPRDEEDAQKIETRRNSLEAVCSCYWKYVASNDLSEFEILGIEVPFSFDLRKMGSPIDIVGYIDGVWRHKKSGVIFLVEHKYQSDLADELIALDLQVSLYTIALMPKYGILPTLYNVCRKPQYKPKKGEDHKGFLKRVRDEVLGESKKLQYNPVTGYESRFLVRRIYSRGRMDIDSALQQVANLGRLMVEIERDPSKTWRHTGDHCKYYCPYREICIHEDPILVDEFFIPKKVCEDDGSQKPGGDQAKNVAPVARI